MSQWKKDGIINYEPEQRDFIQDMKDKPETCTFNIVGENENDIRLIKKHTIGRCNEVNHPKIKDYAKESKEIFKFAKDIHGDCMLNEAFLALYKVNKIGGLKRLEERDISLGIGRKFIESNKGNMMLTRSTDLSIISLCNFDQF